MLATILVVALVLLLTYRSPWLWLVPLVVVGLGDQTASGIVYLLAKHAGLVVNGESAGILRVLVFGAGTDYALLLIARYREELRLEDDRHLAMRRALLRAGPAILASAATVTASLLCLGLVSTLNNDRSLGFVGAIGIACAVAYGLVLLPAVLLLFERGVFWPFVPRLGQSEPTRTGIWSKVGAAVARGPRVVIAACAVLLAVMASGLLSLHTGLTPSEQYRNRVESVTGQQLLDRYFPSGASVPTYVVANAGAASAVLQAVRQSPGVASAEVTDHNRKLVQMTATLSSAPNTDASYAAIRDLRSRLARLGGANALVGGSVATDLDSNDALAHDTAVVIPSVLVVVLVVLILLLRSLLGPILLVLSVVASYFASLGAVTNAFTHLFGFGGTDANVVLLGFLFLVAFGVDYNIFLVGRARQEAEALGTGPGTMVALAVTGGVITSAGIVLAATFSVLGVLPLLLLTELGMLVAFGVLFDTLVVRSVLVPAVLLALDRAFWWPSRLSHRAAAALDVQPAPVRDRGTPE